MRCGGCRREADTIWLERGRTVCDRCSMEREDNDARPALTSPEWLAFRVGQNVEAILPT